MNPPQPTSVHAGFNPNHAEREIHIKNTTPRGAKKKAAHHPVKKAHVLKRLHKITHGRHRHHK